ncbi:AAA domain-containing protein [Archangium primigenium]|uniref:AAA domain-containing protein n=1 Tax=[Archangium] primigenium TaxID=2792470 RepID=UPI003083FE48
MAREQALLAAGVDINTIDAFQGREKDAVLLSLVRSNGEEQISFLSDLRRMNVMLTQARRHRFVAGNSVMLSSHSCCALHRVHVGGLGLSLHI